MESEKSLTYLPMASDDFGYPDESKEGLFTHQDWQGIQQKTFINWVNDKLRGNLKVAEWRINDLRHDLRDGLLLIYLLNNLKAPKKVGNGRYNKKPVHVTQKLENLKSCIDFMNQNDIHLVNIGPKDLYDGNAKLIMGLLWTLIKEFQIRSSGKAVSTKDAMLNWINGMIPDSKIKNFTTDWNDGRALCALVDRLKPGLIPNHSSLDRRNGAENCRQGMKMAEEHLDIPTILSAEDMNNPLVDDLSVMTYLSYFSSSAFDRLLKWINEVLPDNEITNFSSDWNNSLNFGAFLEALSSGLVPEVAELDPHKACENIRKLMKKAHDHFGVPSVLTAEEFTDPRVDELLIATYLNNFRSARMLPISSKVQATGEGIKKAFVGRTNVFTVDCSKAGGGQLEVAPLMDASTKINFEMEEVSSHVYRVSYMPKKPGKIKLHIRWSKSEIPGSPFTLSAIDPSKCTVSGPVVTGEFGIVGRPSTIQVTAPGSAGMLDIDIVTSDKTRLDPTVKTYTAGKYDITYTPVRVGVDTIELRVGGELTPGSPYKVSVVDPRQSSVEIVNVQGVAKAGNPIVLQIRASKMNASAIKCIALGEKKDDMIPVTLDPRANDMLFVSFTPLIAGIYQVSVTCPIDHVENSPLSINVTDVKLCIINSPLPSTLQIRQQQSIQVDISQAGPGDFTVQSSDPSIVATKTSKRGNFSVDVLFDPIALGKSEIRMAWSGDDLPRTPFTSQVCDSSQVSVYGHGLSTSIAKIQKPIEFTIQAKSAGPGTPEVRAVGAVNTYAGEITDNRDGTFHASVTPWELGDITLEILWGGLPIPTSPYEMKVIRAIETGSYSAKGDGLRTAIINEKATFGITTNEPGLVVKDVLKVSIVPSPSDPMDEPYFSGANMDVLDQDNGMYNVSYTIYEEGRYSISVICDDTHITGSPFVMQCITAPDAGAINVFGAAFSRDAVLVVGKPIDFSVDTSRGGVGQLKVLGEKPDGGKVQVFMAEDHELGVYNVKIDAVSKGIYTINVLWANSPIPESPFIFEISDPSKVKLSGLPLPTGHLNKVNKPVEFTVNVTNAGSAAKLEVLCQRGSGENVPKDPMHLQELGKGILQGSLTPRRAGVFYIHILMAGLGIKGSPFRINCVDASAFKVEYPQEEAFPVKEPFKFHIIGVPDMQSLTVKVKQGGSKIPVKVYDAGDATALAQFVPKESGKVDVEVLCAGEDLPGGLFSIIVVDMEKVSFQGKLPSSVQAGQELTLMVKHKGAGTGKLIVRVIEGGQHLSVRVKDETDLSSSLIFTGGVVGNAKVSVKYSGADVPGSPWTMQVYNPAKCIVKSEQLRNASCKISEPVFIFIDGTEGGACEPRVEAKGEKGTYKVKLEKEEEFKYMASFTPWMQGHHTVEIYWGDLPVAGSPFVLEVVKPVDRGKVSLSGDGLKKAIAGQYAEFTVTAMEANLVDSGILTVTMTEDKVASSQENFITTDDTPEDLELKMNIKDNANGTYLVKYLVPNPGIYEVNVCIEGNPVPKSPFSVRVVPGPNASKCKAFGPALQSESIVVGEPIDFNVDYTRAGFGNLKVKSSDPNNNPARYYTADISGGNNKVLNVKLEPSQVGRYVVNITWESTVIPGSPFEFNVCRPKACDVMGLPLPGKVGKLNEVVQFSVETHGAGTGTLETFFVLNGRKQDIVMTGGKGSLYDCSFTPETSGELIVHAKFSGHHIAGSPYKMFVLDSKDIGVVGDFLHNRVFKIFEPVSFIIQGIAYSSKGNIKVSASGPTKETSVSLAENPDGTSMASFIPTEAGMHEIYVVCAGSPVDGSPFKVPVADPHKCTLLGKIPAVLHVRKTEELIIKSVGAGSGKLSAACEDAPDSMFVEITQPHTDTHLVKLTPLRITGTLLHIRWAEDFICGTPVMVSICDASTCKVSGTQLFMGKGNVGEAISFQVNTENSGKGDLSVKPKGPSAVYNVEIRESPVHEFKCSFVPWEMGEHVVDVLWGGFHVPGSPFRMKIEAALTSHLCNATGEGLKVAKLNELTNFTIVSNQSGLLKKRELHVSITGVHAQVPVEIIDNNNSSYSVRYTIEQAGAYLINVKFRQEHIPGSPFKLNVLSGPRAEGVRMFGEVFKDKAVLLSGRAQEFKVDARNAGPGKLEVQIFGPENQVIQPYVAQEEPGVYAVKIDTPRPGKYTVHVQWSGMELPKSPYRFKVHQAPDASKVKAYGPGLQNGSAGQRGDFTIETKKAGYGMLMIRVHGVKDAYKINAVPIREEDPRTLIASYEPKQAGKYSISIHWAGQHIPGSPFEVLIRGEGPEGVRSSMAVGQGMDDEVLPELPSSSWPSRPPQQPRRPGGGSQGRLQQRQMTAASAMGYQPQYTPQGMLMSPDQQQFMQRQQQSRLVQQQMQQRRRSSQQQQVRRTRMQVQDTRRPSGKPPPRGGRYDTTMMY